MPLYPGEYVSDWSADLFDQDMADWEEQQAEAERQRQEEIAAAQKAQEEEFQRWLDEAEAERAQAQAQAEAAYAPPPPELWQQPQPDRRSGWTAWQDQTPMPSIYDARSGGTLTYPTQAMPTDWREQQQSWEQYRDQPIPEPSPQWDLDPEPFVPEPPLRGQAAEPIDLSSREAFYRTAAPHAQRIQDETGIPANIMLGIAVNEGALARGTVASRYNNLFGIKAGPNYPGPTTPVINAWEVIGGRNTTQPSRFRAYDSPEESFRDFARFLYENPRYAGALQQTGNPEAFVRALQRAGYATDPNWSNQVLNIARQAPAPAPPPPPLEPESEVAQPEEGNYVTYQGWRYPVTAEIGGYSGTPEQIDEQPVFGPAPPTDFVPNPGQWPGPPAPEDYAPPTPRVQGEEELPPGHFVGDGHDHSTVGETVTVQPSGGINPNTGWAFPVQGYGGQVALHWGSHQGAADLFAAPGTPVVAAMGGRVTGAGFNSIGGNYVFVRGSDGNEYYYAHLDRTPAVRAGQNIETGTYLGGVGDTGNARGTGAHLHFGAGRSILNGTGPAGGAGADFDAVGMLRATLQSGGRPAGRDEHVANQAAVTTVTPADLADQEEGQRFDTSVVAGPIPETPQPTDWQDVLAAARDTAGQAAGAVVESGLGQAVGNAAWQLGSVPATPPWMARAGLVPDINLRDVANQLQPVTGVIRAGEAEDVVAAETRNLFTQMMDAYELYGAEDPRTQALADRYNAAAAQARGSDTGFAAAERHPAFGAGELAGAGLTAALTLPLAPNAAAGLGRNLASLALDPTNALGLGAEGLGAAARGVGNLARRTPFDEVAGAVAGADDGFHSLPFARPHTGTPPPGVSQNTADFYQMDAPLAGQRGNLLDWVRHNLDPRDAFPHIRDIERDVLQTVGPSGPRPHSLATQLPGVVMETDQILRRELNPILDASERAGNSLDDLNFYMRAKQTEELANAGFQTPGGKTAAEAQAALREIEQQIGPQRFQALEQAEKELQDFQYRTALEPSRGTFLTDTQIQDMLNSNQHYFPHEVLDFTAREGGNFGSGSRSINMAQQQFRHRVGSERSIAAPLDAIVEKTYRIRYAQERQKAADALIEGMQATQPSLITRQVGDQRPPGGFDTISRFWDGQKETYFVPDFLAAEAKQLDAAQMNVVSQFFNAINTPSKIAMTQTNPDFILRNLGRDAFDSFHREGLIPGGYHHLRGIYSAIAQDDGFFEWAKSHSAMGGMFESGRGQAPKTLAELRRGKGETMARMIYPNPLKFIERVNEVIEQGPAIGAYMAQSGKWQGPHLPGPLKGLIGEPVVDPTTAAARTREMRVDFSNAHPFIKAMNPISIFLNANIKGSFNALEPIMGGRGMGTARQGRAALRLGLLTAAAAAAYAYNHRPEVVDAYNKIPQYDRENNIILVNPFQPTGTDERGREVTSYIGTPKPTIGRMLWNIADDVMRYVQQNNPRRYDEIAKSLLGSFTPWTSGTDIATFGLPPVSQAVLEAQANYDTYRMAPIESEAMQGQPVQARSAANTSELARKLANNPVSIYLGWSPVKWDHMIGAAFGGTGRTAVRGVDEIGRAAGVFPPVPQGQEASPSVQLARVPGLRGIVRAGSNETAQQFDQLGERMRRLDVQIMDELNNDAQYTNAPLDEQQRMQRSLRAGAERQIRAELGIAQPRRPGEPPKYVEATSGRPVESPALQVQIDRFYARANAGERLSAQERAEFGKYRPSRDWQRWDNLQDQKEKEWLQRRPDLIQRVAS